MNDYIKVYEVGPRDGLQNELTRIETSQKHHLIDSLVAAGLQHIELTSFVHPQAVPQMADADVVMATAVSKHQDAGIQFIGLVFNERGYDRAIEAGCKAMAFGVSVSDTFSQRNTRRSPQEAFATTKKLVSQANRDGVWTRVYVMAAWVCPFEGITDPQRTTAVAEKIWELGIDELAVADTIGHANPLAVGQLMETLGRRLDMNRLAVHLHDTQAIGLANATTALQAGVRIFDSSIGGLGGCPFAPGAAGNLATEDLVFLAYKLGMGSGVDFRKLWQIVYDVEQWVGRPIGGRIRQWWESVCQNEPAVMFN
ncbi:MAG: hydroxymethylglutaryl-CoA lyase [Chloroflexi bacterium]|nr:MAG: hydroxymethylglutaryl-CoA lyase [Chloroflexota bacterium]